MSENKQKTIAKVFAKDLQEFWGIPIDSKLPCETHIDKLCKKSDTKTSVRTKIRSYITFDKRRIIMESLHCVSVELLLSSTVVSQQKSQYKSKRINSLNAKVAIK